MWNGYQAEYLGVSMDERGLITRELESALRAGPKFIYALPNFQNPTGVTLALERREELVRLAAREGVPVIEDDPYGQLRYQGAHLPSLVALDGMRREGEIYSGNVIYLSTFSKTLAPGLRLGWVIAPAEVIQSLVRAKQGSDLHTGTLVQMIVFEVARQGFLDKHVRKIRASYGVRRDSMITAMRKHFPEGVRWTEPDGGLFLWVTLPEGHDAAVTLRASIDAGVAFVPGSAFFHDGKGNNHFRLNFSFAPPEVIEEGIRRLGSVLTKELQTAPVPHKLVTL